jgi:SAM-dependent methyltransferase
MPATACAKPYSEACERNRGPILGVLSRVFADRRAVLEIGSGTGQHAVAFGAGMPWLVWQPSDVTVHLDGIRAWVCESALENVRQPLALDVNVEPWPLAAFDAAFSANTAHIMSEPEVELFFERAARALRDEGAFALYGPFRYGGRHTSESNARFDASLRARDLASGIRDFEWIDALARREGFAFVEDNAMPANNRLLVWRRVAARRP